MAQLVLRTKETCHSVVHSYHERVTILSAWRATHRHDEARILSIFLASDVLNISLCVRVGLGLTGRELHRVLHEGVGSHCEFADWSFLHPDDLPYELAHPTRSYHLTSGCRKQMELYHRHGTLRPLAVATKLR